ncbi:purine-nucleoside phosphorylase [Ureaplasma zalophigenitalium]|uniref:Uridine phosphorylase n=1 Tax=Ureaplasma zalophigenitalium TaxID=907723 RepID=A0ABT3BP12_9BACT|nr:purine-nucleoside phosphorylase [Ureaplasma zalophigenitalium]MCV3753995.1 purine-nucleoside phosphorylase [Ureaplasma zalophigenitalium]
MTPHIHAKKDEIAKVVLMPGDPVRARWIAETFLTDAILVNDVRGMLCYTGYYKGERISVMGHGMGIPSIGIYSYELFKFYDVDTIIRVGSTGAYVEDLKLGDVILVNKAYTDSTYPELIGAKKDEENYMYPTPSIYKAIKESAQELNHPLIEATCHASDVFYNNGHETLDEIKKRTHSQCVDMESAGLFANAQILNKNAATMLTVSDSLVIEASMTPAERATTFKEMMEIALNAGVNFLKK